MTTMREQPLISVDVVVVQRQGDSMMVAAHRRLNEPYQGDLALPGVLLLPGESLTQAGDRALAKLDAEMPPVASSAHQTGAFDGANRDPRGATISVAYLTVLSPEYDGDGIDEVVWLDPSDTLPFDHSTIVRESLFSLRDLMKVNPTILRSVLGEKFRTSDALGICRHLGYYPASQKNFSRWLSSTPGLRRVASQSASARDIEWEWEQAL